MTRNNCTVSVWRTTREIPVGRSRPMRARGSRPLDEAAADAMRVTRAGLPPAAAHFENASKMACQQNNLDTRDPLMVRAPMFCSKTRRFRLLWLGSLLVVSIAGSAGAQCTKETDCKGDRVCEGGNCVSPTDGSGRPQPTPADASFRFPNYCCTPQGRLGPFPNFNTPAGGPCWASTPYGPVGGTACY